MGVVTETVAVRRDPARYANGNNMGWQLAGFSKKTEYLVSEFPITREQMLRIRPLFDVGDDLWMVFEYPVSLDLWPQIDAVLNCGPPDPGQTYVVEGYATDY